MTQGQEQDPFAGEQEAGFETQGTHVTAPQTQPFTGETKKRKNYRLLIGGLATVVILIGALFLAAQGIKVVREKWAEEKAAREKEQREKLAQARKGRQFSLEREGPSEPEAAPKPDAAASAPAIELKNPGPAPTAKPPAAPPPKPKPPSMMVDGAAAGSSERAAAEKAAAMAGESKSEDGGTVQALANKQASGKPATSTAQASAAQLGDRSFVLARGSWIPCILETQLDTTVAGNTTCVVPEDVYSDDGKALLIEKGSRSFGSFGGTLKVGDKRIAGMWSRIKTTRGVVIDVESPGADGVGTTGMGGYVDNHWVDRIGAAVLLSFIEDGLAYAVAERQNQQSQANSSNSNSGYSSTNVYMPNNAVGSTRRLSEKILDSTINIPPTLYKNRGDRIAIFVNRDLWFDSTYKLLKVQ